MSGDLVSLRMLLVAAVRSHQELWRKAASMASVPIEFATHDSAFAPGAFDKRGTDVCVVDAAMPDANRSAAIKAARAAVPKPLIFVSAPRSTARFDDIDGMLTKPASIEEAVRSIETCIRAKFPTRVLIVDDSTTMRNIVRKILSASRFPLEIQEASEGSAALEQLGGENIGIVFLDYNMPGLTGIETLLKIKRKSPEIAVVMMSSAADSAIGDRARSAGALAFLKKPFYPADIDAVLENYYGLQAARN